jgi:hypothetical protein
MPAFSAADRIGISPKDWKMKATAEDTGQPQPRPGPGVAVTQHESLAGCEPEPAGTAAGTAA